ncbi:hypothetical protein PICMEDRAFT_14332 [Pichia membranifaciens NRRL Y-2026]|uniref:Uncharacterized protein n=1 Tax=Pichia membranifaciens NRRL Y-2026 TaxID=763406 RepID=A0A1E3NRT3_9ASCO|nr:hypothetical protein PICMEDRAFT_14332 [Pichia membranifaciens NRRL Y-2026]ODQ48802.1 hypothetical protein PICMEDRAFT_14332 [Pichia membranifaciens NRRL Y-2026]
MHAKLGGGRSSALPIWCRHRSGRALRVLSRPPYATRQPGTSEGDVAAGDEGLKGWCHSG